MGKLHADRNLSKKTGQVARARLGPEMDETIPLAGKIVGPGTLADYVAEGHHLTVLVDVGFFFSRGGRCHLRGRIGRGGFFRLDLADPEVDRWMGICGWPATISEKPRASGPKVVTSIPNPPSVSLLVLNAKKR